MGRYRKKQVVVEAITFDEFIKYGQFKTGDIDKMPWSFEYKGRPVTHENDECYLIQNTSGTHNFTPDDVLLTGVYGEIYLCPIDIFNKTYDKVED